MNKYRLWKMLEYVQREADFPFDIYEVEESLPAVLAFFSYIPPRLESEEEAEVQRVMWDRALEVERAEMAFLASVEDEGSIAYVEEEDESFDTLLVTNRRRRLNARGDWLRAISE